MPLWTEMDPGNLTGYAREALRDAVSGNNGLPDPLVDVLPYVEQAGTTVEFIKGENGNVPLAQWRAFDAEPAHVGGEQGEEIVAKMAPLSSQQKITESDQLRLRTAGEDVRTAIVQNAAANGARGIVAATRMVQGQVLATGRLSIRQIDFKSTVDYGRAANLTATAPLLWSADGAKPLDDVRAHAELIETEGGIMPSEVFMSRQALNLFLSSEQAKAEFGVQRALTLDEAQGRFGALGLPTIRVYEGRTAAGRVLPADSLVFAAGGGQSGATVFGQTLASSLPEYGLAAVEQPGIVAGVFINDGIPPAAHVYVDSLVLPVLIQPNTTGALKVL